MIKCCNANGPNKYTCTVEVKHTPGGVKIPHDGDCVARAFVGDKLGSEIVRWRHGAPPKWNPQYHGR